MALVVADRVKESTTTTGTGTVNLAGAETGFQTFVAGVGNSNTTYYSIVDGNTGDFEVGIGTVTDASPDTLSRDTILQSSNSDSAVNFGSGTKSVFCTQPADKAVFKNASGHVNLPDNAEFQVGNKATTGDLRIRHNGTHGQIQNYTNELHLTNFANDKDVRILTDNGSGGTADYFRADGSNGEAVLYHYGTEKFATKSTGVDVQGNITVSGTVDGRDLATDGTKLDGIEASATADQTASEILTAIKTVDGSGSGLDADTLDGSHASTFATQSNVETYINRSYVDKHSASNLAVGWYTIAQNTGNRAVARFALWDVNSGDHQSVIFYAAHHYGTDASNTLTVLDNSRFSGSPFRYLRIKDGGTYDGAALQVYIDDADNEVNVAIVGDNVQTNGWALVDFLADASAPSLVDNWSSFTEKSKIDLDLIDQGGMATTGPIYADGDTTQSKVLTTAGGTLTGNLVLGDGIEARFGAGTDLVLKHVGGGSSSINNNSGTLQINQFANDSDVVINSDNGSGSTANYFRADGSTGEAILYHYGTSTLSTKNYGVEIQGDSTNGSGAIQLNCEQNTHGVKIKGPPHSASANYTLTLPNDDGTNGQALTTDGSGGLSWTTITSGSTLTIKDEGSALSTAATTLNFTGAGVVATGSGAEKTITISGGGGSGGSGVGEGKALVFANLFG